MEKSACQGNGAAASAAGIPSIDDEYVWTTAPLSASNPLHLKMRDLERELRCAVCQEFFRNPVSVVPCQHTFCSECIQSNFKEQLGGIKRTPSCPKCRKPVDTGGVGLRKCIASNRTVEEMVAKYQVLRDDLRRSLCQLTTQTANGSTGSVSDGDDSKPKTRRSPRSRRSETDGDYNPDQEEADEGDSAVECSERRKRLPKTHYNVLKRKQLIALCNTHGLSTKGTDKDLKDRHSLFVLLHNAECDSFKNPRPVAEIVKEVAQREKARKEEKMVALCNGSSSHASHMENLKRSRKALGEGTNAGVVSSGNASFDAELQSNFSRMIQEQRERMGKKDITNNGQPKDGVVTRSNQEVLQPTMVNGVNNSETTTAAAAKPRAESRSSSPLVETSNVASGPRSTVAPPTPNLPIVPAQPPLASRRRAAALPSNSTPNGSSFLPSTAGSVRANKRPKRSSSSPWQCHVCTFLNKSHTWASARCEMCQKPRETVGKGKGDVVVNVLEC